VTAVKLKPSRRDDEAFDEAITKWLEDSGAQDASVTIKLECSGFVLRVSDRTVVATMLKAELQRRRELRGAMS
jgi:hypothetical protein